MKTMSMHYAWAITHNVLDGPSEEFPFQGQFSFTEILSHPLGVPFRMLDDDGIVYYEGIFVPLSDDATGFEPLDDYGRPNDGCTSIEYREGKEWKKL